MFPTRQEVGGATGLLRQLVGAVFYNGRMHEMFSQVRNVFQEEFFMAQCDMIEKDEVMVDLAHVSHVRNDFDGVFLSLIHI